MNREKIAREVDELFCTAGTTKKEALLLIADHVIKLCLEARKDELNNAFSIGMCGSFYFTDRIQSLTKQIGEINGT